MDPRQATPGGRKTDREIWRDLIVLEADIRAGIRMINQIFELRQSATSQRRTAADLGGEADGQSAEHLLCIK